MQTKLQKCNRCLITNRIIIEPHSQAWRCICGVGHWLDQQARIEHMVHHGISFNEAERDLIEHNIDRLPIMAFNNGINHGS